MMLNSNMLCMVSMRDNFCLCNASLLIEHYNQCIYLNAIIIWSLQSPKSCLVLELVTMYSVCIVDKKVIDNNLQSQIITSSPRKKHICLHSLPNLDKNNSYIWCLWHQRASCTPFASTYDAFWLNFNMMI